MMLVWSDAKLCADEESVSSHCVHVAHPSSQCMTAASGRVLSWVLSVAMVTAADPATVTVLDNSTKQAEVTWLWHPHLVRLAELVAMSFRIVLATLATSGVMGTLYTCGCWRNYSFNKVCVFSAEVTLGSLLSSDTSLLISFNQPIMYCQPHSGILIGTLSHATLLPRPMSPHVENPHSLNWRNRESQVTILFLFFFPPFS